VDVAHANAGISANKPTLELAEEEWRRTIDVNLTGAFLTAQAAGRRMVAQGVRPAALHGQPLSRDGRRGACGLFRQQGRRREPRPARWPANGASMACA
jgi:NAD(P)-dependent dehydrogenase (short-subunit alcohol dehydrogenase family)